MFACGLIALEFTISLRQASHYEDLEVSNDILTTSGDGALLYTVNVVARATC